jgi:hypothetical protein
MTGCETVNDPASELEFVGCNMPNINVSKPEDTGKRRALSILTEISSQGTLKPK